MTLDKSNSGWIYLEQVQRNPKDGFPLPCLGFRLQFGSIASDKSFASNPVTHHHMSCISDHPDKNEFIWNSCNNRFQRRGAPRPKTDYQIKSVCKLQKIKGFVRQIRKDKSFGECKHGQAPTTLSRANAN